MEGFDKVAEETVRTSLRVDAMESGFNRVADMLQAFLNRVHIDDRLLLVPEQRRLSLGPIPTTRSASPNTPKEIPMDEDDTEIGGIAMSPAATCSTPSDQPGERMVGPFGAGPNEMGPNEMGPIEMGPIASGSGLVPSPEPTPPPSTLPGPDPPSPIAAPTLAVIPATPQGSQDVAMALAVPSLPTTMTEDPLPPPPIIRSRSRTPVAELLGTEGRTTRARSRGKTPI